MRPILSRCGLLVVLWLSGCAHLPATPQPPHDYFQIPDTSLTVSDPLLYRRPLHVRYKILGQGTPLVLVHGLQTSSYSWRYVLSGLARHHRVVALDLIGSGLSDHPADFNYSPVHMADFLDAFRTELATKEPAFAKWDVVGNSLGGAYTAAYAARYPERIGKLVIIHAPGFMDKAPVLGIEEMRKGAVPESFSALFGPWMVREYQRYYRPNLLSEEEVEQYSLPYRDREGKRAFWHIVREGLGPEVAGQLEPILAEIHAPTLLIWALNDELIPPWTGYRWEHAIAGSRLVWIPESSHFPHVEAPDTTMRYIEDFLGGASVCTQVHGP